jgi:hypothetical protein
MDCVGWFALHHGAREAPVEMGARRRAIQTESLGGYSLGWIDLSAF